MSTTFYRGENPLYADKLNTAFSERVSRGGDTMDGLLTLACDPVTAFDAATKQYVDRLYAIGLPPGGPFLPLAGGTVAWLAIATAGTVWQDSAPARLFNVHNAWTGTSTLPSAVDLNRILTVDSISAAAGSFGGGGFVTALNLESQTGGAASTGGRIALNVLQRQTASTGNFAAGGAYNGVAASFVAIADFNEGGTSFIPGGHTGSLFGINPAVALRNTATYFSELCGGEVNVTAHLGSSVFVKYGWTIVKEAADAVQGAAGLDSALAFSDQLGAQPWDYGILFGNEGGQWAFDANATLMGTRLNTSQGTGGAIGTAKWVMDFLPMTTTGGLLRGTGFVIENTGITRVGFGALKPDPAGMLIDIEGKQAASATIANGGSNYVSGGYWPDVNGNVWHIDSVGGGGNVTGVTLVKAVVTGSQPTPIALAPSPYLLQATGAVLNVTYVSGTTLSVQPSGGATVFGGPVTLPAGSTGAFLPLTGGTVSGATTFSAAGNALLVNNDVRVGTITSNGYATRGNTTTLSGATVPAKIANFGGNWNGTSTVTDNTSLASVSLGSSFDSASLSSSAGSIVQLLIASNYGGPTYSGSRNGMFVQMNWNTASPLINYNDAIIGYASVVAATVNAGGVTGGFGTTQFGQGQLFGANPWAKLSSGATFFRSIVGEEVDLSIGAGASCNTLAGLTVVLTSEHQTKAIGNSLGVGVLAQTGAAANLDAGYVLGGFGSQWPLDANTGYVFRTSYSQNTVDPHCAGGIDLLHLIPDGTGGKYGRGFSYRGPGTVAASAMDGTGAWKIGTGYISGGAGGLSVDASLYVLTGTPTVATGGSGYTNTDRVTDGSGNLFSCTVVGGVVTAVTVLKRAEGQITNLTGTVATNAVHRAGSGFGSGLTLNETWAQATTLSLQPSGGAVQVGTGCIAANATVATVLGSLGPVGSHTTVQEWIAIKNASGVTRYIPAF